MKPWAEALLAMFVAPATTLFAAIAVDAGHAVGAAIGWLGGLPWPETRWDFASPSGIEALVAGALLITAATISNVWAIVRPGGASLGVLFGLLGGITFHAPSFRSDTAPGWLWAVFIAILFLAPLLVAGGYRLAHPHAKRRVEAAVRMRAR